MQTEAQRVAESINERLAELRREASAAGLETLAYLIDMARIEANARTLKA
jgi:hypothetical protein